ncbi:MAG: ParB/RepB/Spo0J family partition protein [Thiobacillus sp.]|nr:ParB/RepB/Spo0J family partition protein [Thiobacillus sp.]
MKIKITEAIFNDYVERLSSDPLTFPKAWPGQVGMVEVDEDMAHLVRLDAEKMAKTSNPKMAMAYRNLANQVERSREIRDEEVSHAKHVTGLVMLEASQISTGDNVRTVFDQASIEELAEDIKAHGLINPITVRTNNGHYVLVAGERRMRACQIAGVPIMANVIEADNVLTRRIQLAENIHREDLSLEDKANAVRELYEQLGTMQAVADQVKKSKSWVSKLVALSEPDLSYRTRRLLEEGKVEDLEILGIMNRIENTCDLADANVAYEKLVAGELTREQAREFLRSKTEKRQKHIKEEEARRKEAKARRDAEEAKRKAEREKQLAEEAARPPKREYLHPNQAVHNLLRFYVTTLPREHQGKHYEIVTEFSRRGYAGDGVTDEDIMKAWRDLVEAYADWGGNIVTEEYFQENA